MNVVTECTPRTRFLIGNYGEPVKRVRAIARTLRPLLNEQQVIRNFTGFLIIDHEGWRRDITVLTTRQIEHNADKFIVHFNKWVSKAPCTPVGLAVWCHPIYSWAVEPLPIDPQVNMQASFSVPGSCITLHYTIDRCDALEAYIPYEDVLSLGENTEATYSKGK